MTKNDRLFIEDWILYHGFLFGYENLYIIDASDDPAVLSVYERYASTGMNLIVDQTDMNGMAAQLTKHMKDNAGPGDFLIKLDTDEFLAYRKGDEVDNKNIQCLFDFIPVTYKKYKASYVLWSVPQSNDHRRPAREATTFSPMADYSKKSFFHACSFQSVDLGCHAGTTIDNEGAIGTVLTVFHFCDVGWNVDIERAKTVLVSHRFIDEDDTREVMIEKLRSRLQGPSWHKAKMYLSYLLDETASHDPLLYLQKVSEKYKNRSKDGFISTRLIRETLIAAEQSLQRA